jgi:hypothetical protein
MRTPELPLYGKRRPLRSDHAIFDFCGSLTPCLMWSGAKQIISISIRITI